jgi:hypothetical protein
MAKVIRLTESELIKVVKKIISEQPETNTTLKNIDLKTFLDGYSNKLSNILKGKPFNVVTKNVNGEYVHPVIKFTGYADRNHTQDKQPIYKIKNFDFISSAIIVDPKGLPGFQKNQKVYVSFNLMFNSSDFVKFGEITMNDETFKNSVKLFGWTPKDFGGVQNLNLQGQTLVKYA